MTVAGTSSILGTNAKLDRVVQMVTTLQAAMQHSIEDICSEFRKDQEEAAEHAVEKAYLFLLS